MNQTGCPVANESSRAGERRAPLEELHRWAAQQRFSPPWWLRSPDLQTSWYVIREIGAGLRERRISARQIWKYIEGQEKDYRPAVSEGAPGSSRAAADPPRQPEPVTGFPSQFVELPFEQGGFLTGALNLAAAGRRLAILFHGLEGSAEGTYMRETARRLLERGISALRVNMVNCGGSEACTRLFYHAGFTLMLEICVQWALRHSFRRIAPVGFSLGGSLVLKYLGGSNFSGSDAVAGGAAVSPPIDLARSAACIDRPRNKFYRYRFLKSMFRTMKRKQQLFPDLFPHRIEWVRTITDFDDRYTAPANGFASGSDYYEKASSLPYLRRIDRPALILHSRDDIYIPFDTFAAYDWKQNRNLIPLFPEHGGHLGFHASARVNYMETTVADFCDRLL